jgi:hypothetical protein
MGLSPVPDHQLRVYHPLPQAICLQTFLGYSETMQPPIPVHKQEQDQPLVLQVTLARPAATSGPAQQGSSGFVRRRGYDLED